MNSRIRTASLVATAFAAVIAATLTLALAFSPAAFGQSSSPDLILFNGKIFTSNASRPYVQALAIRGQRIVATGDTAAIQALAGAQTKRIDLDGRTVIPGINDAHQHIGLDPPGVTHVDLETMDPTWEQLKSGIIAAAAKAPKGGILYAEIGKKVFEDTSVARDALDAVAPDHPVFLTTITGHAVIMNSAALDLARIRENQKDPVGGRYERAADGKLTGVVREYAVLQLNRTLGKIPDDGEALRQLRELFVQEAKFGITSAQDMSDGIDPGRAVKLFEEAPTPIRIRAMRMPGTTPSGRDTREGLTVPHHPSPLITVSGTKWLLDGVPIENTLTPRAAAAEHTADTLEDDVRHLPLTFSEKDMEAMLRESLANQSPLMLHVSGYPAAAAMLDAMDATGGKSAWRAKRVRFEHGDGLFPDLIPRAKELGIVVVQNPTHLAISSMLGGSKTPYQRLQPLRTLLAAGIPVALGSDGPMNPYLNIMLACIDPGRPSEAITREQAVTAYTLTSAYAEFAEKEKGSLEPGKLADLAVLSQDIFSVPLPNLPKTQSVLTLVGGKIIYDAKVVNPN